MFVPLHMHQLPDIAITTEKILDMVGDFDPQTRAYSVHPVVKLTQEDYDTCLNLARNYAEASGYQHGLMIATTHPQYGPLINAYSSPVSIVFYIKAGVLILETEIKIVPHYEDPDLMLADV